MPSAPDHDTVLAAIGLANRAPSVHNTQPWRWLLGAGSVHLMADRTRHLAATDPDGRDLLLSCGAALHHLRVAFAALGWHAVVHHLPDEHDPDHLVAVECEPRLPTEDDITGRRRTLSTSPNWPRGAGAASPRATACSPPAARRDRGHHRPSQKVRS